MGHDLILILDFGSQYTQLIARRVRELAVYCEIIPHSAPAEEIAARAPVGLILSGGPQSVYADDAPRCDPRLFALGVPVLGICYGLQLQAQVLGGTVAPSARREYGPASIEVCRESPLFAGLPRQLEVWMSHGDEVREAPPGFAVTARSVNASCALEDPARRLFGLQFHPEVAHTPQGRAILANFVLGVCGAAGDWTMASFAQESVARIRAQVGEGRALCGLSGGVDSTVAATLVSQALGERLTCLFVDTGLLRAGEFEAVCAGYRGLPLSLESLDASARFLARLAGVADPEEKRRRIGAEFIAVFDEAAARRGATHLVQGTLYPDVIESAPVKGPSAVIKSHHNVGGLPARMRLSLVEPLRELFKDEVRALGRQLGVPDALLWRQPFPGPGLAVRILGEVTPERLATLRAADAIVTDEIRRAGLDREVWQAFAVLLPVRSVGVMGDGRTYEAAVTLRAVTSTDGMTADWARLPPEVLSAISGRIVSEVRGVNRVVYDITSKPPATIEWE